ncbi:MAG TPA: class I adenylate-forming enzyme family protein [Ramlibacter sp.]|nr:class I adenylate-forming enzyme family protein [Ramlibacter sp.]
MNIGLLLQMAASALPDRVAVGHGTESLSYDALYREAAAAARWIGAQQDVEHVAYLGLNSARFPVALFGAAMAGRIFVPLNYRLPDDQLRKQAARLAPALIVADDDLCHRLDGVAGVRTISRSRFIAETAGEESHDPELPEDADAVAVLLFTSGTTGEPKASILRHRHLFSYVAQTVEFAGSEPDEAILVSVPPYHIAGISSVLTSVYGGRRIVVLPAFSPSAWIDAARDAAVTHAMVVPTMLGRILDMLDATGGTLPALRHLSYGGGRMPASVIERALGRLPHVDFVNAYGLTETSSTIAILGPEDHRRALGGASAEERQRLGSVGRPLPNLQIEIRDADGRAVGVRTSGEIWVRGEQISGEYRERKAVRDDGWLNTNDAGWMDEEGYLYVEGRLDDVIVRGAENISPGEVEDVLRLHPAVADVAVVGLPDDEWGERVAAAVVTKAPVPAEELRNWVRERLRSTKAPEEVHFYPELPYNETGKLLRRVLKQELAQAAARTA